MSFEIRVICAPADMVRISTALGKAFQTGLFRSVPARDGQSKRLYVTADHRPEPEPRLTPEEAYALAPSIISEIGWTARTLANSPCLTELERDFYLRKAALLDRIALLDEAEGMSGDASETADAAALRLLDMDKVGPVAADAINDPRGYVRQEYARWVKDQ
ncbi:hypothetical protein [Streptomyces sp. NBC_00005]|uniref:hypothetical protein n=1 Tax=Streptomyces sp. NBC_00005 TaxID=2903609 RepID=UPI003252D9E9